LPMLGAGRVAVTEMKEWKGDVRGSEKGVFLCAGEWPGLRAPPAGSRGAQLQYVGGMVGSGAEVALAASAAQALRQGW